MIASVVAQHTAPKGTGFHLLPPTWQTDWRRLNVEFAVTFSRENSGQPVTLLLSTKPTSAYGRMLLKSAVTTTPKDSPHVDAIGQLTTRRQLQRFHGRISSVTGQLADRYRLGSAHERSRRERDPHKSPHGLFRDLQSGNTMQAIEFLETFGPLTLPQQHRWGASPIVTVDLIEFWALQLRYSLVVGLYEALGNVTALRRAWRAVHVRHEDASMGVLPVFSGDSVPSVVKIPLGARRSESKSHEITPTWWPWDQKAQSFDVWLDRTSFTDLRESALHLVHSELNFHSRGAPTWWERGWERSKTKLRPAAFVESLWSAMWEYFGLDTAGLFWRRCRACQRLFYPSRQAQVYHSADEQALISKREAARKRRARERQART